jgi:PAN domain
MSASPPPQRNNTILYGMLSMMICALSFVTVIVIVKLLNDGLYIPESAPASIKFSHTPNAKLIGVPKLDTLNRVSEATCLETCDKNSMCMSVSYSPTERNCILYNLNATVDSELLKTDTNGWDYYEKRYFWSRFGPEITGSLDDFGALDVTEKNVETKKDCAIKCLKKTDLPLCRGFNYDVNAQRCKLVGVKYIDNEANFDKTDSTVYHELILKDEKESSIKTPPPSSSPPSSPPQPPPETFVNYIKWEYDKRFWGVIIVLLFGLWLFRR